MYYPIGETIKTKIKKQSQGPVEQYNIKKMQRCNVYVIGVPEGGGRKMGYMYFK